MGKGAVPGPPASRVTVSVIVGLEGEPDPAGESELHTVLGTVLGWRPDRVLVDLSLMASLDDGSLADLATARDALRADGGDLLVISPSPACADALRHAGLDDLVLPSPANLPPNPRLGRAVVEAAKGMIAERLGVDVSGAADVLHGYAGRAGRTVPDVAADVADRVLDITWVERKAPGAGPRVLYIEDSADNIALMRAVFARWPQITLDAEVTGRAGLDHVRRRRPDLVLLDGNLPDIDGSEVLRRIRAESSPAELPVVVVSADPAVDRRSQMLALGADDYVVKPFAIDHLGHLVARFTGTTALTAVPMR